MIEGEDFVSGDGTAVANIYRSPFAGKNLRLRPSAPGLLSMANSSPCTNGCQLFITCSKWAGSMECGKILDGVLVMRKTEDVPTGPSSKDLWWSQCGEMQLWYKVIHNSKKLHESLSWWSLLFSTWNANKKFPQVTIPHSRGQLHQDFLINCHFRILELFLMCTVQYDYCWPLWHFSTACGLGRPKGKCVTEEHIV